MKSIFSNLLLLLTLTGSAQTELNSFTFKNSKIMETTENATIENLLFSYEKALNTSDVPAVLALYANDGVFMPSEAPTAVGQTAVEQAYSYVFSQIKLNIKFSIDEIAVNGDLAFARTISRGSTDVLAAGITVPEENRELFVLVKENGTWKIGRYMFNKMKPSGK
jgi:uncharacterized protein (TIGR02246 family)